MARIRTIKPDFWTDEKVVELDFAERLLFIGMWNFADDQGYMDYSLKRLKMQVFPGDDVDVSRGLQRLHEFGLIRLYRTPEDSVVIHLVNWAKHQRISNPSRARFTEGDLHECEFPEEAVQRALEDSVRKGREGKGREERTPSSAAAFEDEPDPFDEFWDLYPRKVEKQSARAKWKIALKKTSASEIIDGLREYPFGDDPKFIKHAATWLSKECWADTPDNIRPIRSDDVEKRRWIEMKPGDWRQVSEDAVYFGKKSQRLPVGQRPA